jgi:hypothetical protein
MLTVSYCIFHKRRRKIMGLIPLKTRVGIAALTFAAMAPFVLATPVKAINIGFLDASDAVPVQVTEDGVPTPQFFNGIETVVTRTFTSFPSTVTPTLNPGPPLVNMPGGIVFLEPGTDTISDILRVTITATLPFTRLTFFNFMSDPAVGIDTTGFTRVEETGRLEEVGLAPNPAMGIPDSRFRNSLGAIVDLPFDIRVFVQSDLEVPGPIAGAGLPGLILACGVLVALARRRRLFA